METTVISLESLVQDQGFASLHEFAKIRLTAWLKCLIAESFMPYQKQQFEAILANLQPEIRQPFQDFPEKRHYTIDEQDFFEKTLLLFNHSLGSFAKQEFERYCLEQMQQNDLLIRYYAQKYGTNWADAQANFASFFFDVVEKENDLQMWAEAVEAFQNYQTDLSIIRTWNQENS